MTKTSDWRNYMLAKLINRIQRNHGLEHASIHVLSEKFPNKFSAQGNSTVQGFYLNIYGSLSDEDIKNAITEAHYRMKKGEHHLAVHPNCGTVLLTTATLATLASQLAFGLEMKRQHSKHLTWSVLLNASPSAILAATIGLIVARPLGMYLQANYTTKGDLGALEVVRIERVEPSLVSRIFQVLLGQAGKSHATSYRIDTVG